MAAASAALALLQLQPPSLAQRPHPTSSSFLLPKHRNRPQFLLFCSLNSRTSNRDSKNGMEEEWNGRRRRDVLIQTLFSSSVFHSVLALSASAENESSGDFRIYSDETNKFRISIPQDWLVGAGEPNGFKSVTAFYPRETSDSNVSVVITGLGPDFTKLESFGKVDEFAETLVGGLDRSWQRPPGVAAKLIDSKSANGLYYIEYSLQNPGESQRHIYSAMGMAFNGWYNRLYTVTGQFVDGESENYRSQIEKVMTNLLKIE